LKLLTHLLLTRLKTHVSHVPSYCWNTLRIHKCRYHEWTCVYTYVMNCVSTAVVIQSATTLSIISSQNYAPCLMTFDTITLSPDAIPLTHLLVNSLPIKIW
jgi:hypothetical protein